METQGLGAGSYPEPLEDEEKCYQFDFNATISGYGIVYAKSIEEAKKFLDDGEYDDICDTWDMEIQEITNIREG